MFKFAFVDECLTNYRVTSGSLFDTIQADNVLHMGNASRVLTKRLGHSREADRIINDRVAAFAKTAYLNGGEPRDCFRTLLRCLRDERRPSTFAYLTLSALHIPEKPVDGTVRKMRATKSRTDDPRHQGLGRDDALNFGPDGS